MTDAASRRLLLLVPTTSYRVGDFLDAAGRLGVDVAVGSDQRQVLERYSGGGTLRVDFADPDRGVARIVAHDADFPLAAIIGVDDETTLIAALAAPVSARTDRPPMDPTLPAGIVKAAL